MKSSHSLLIYNIGQLVTPAGAATQQTNTIPVPHLQGRAMRSVEMRGDAAILVEHGVITRIGTSSSLVGFVEMAQALASAEATGKKFDVELFDAQGMTMLPGFVDSHTHAVFAGHRAHEFALRAEGKTYQEIAAAGGGILSTVKATRAASEQELYDIASRRLDAMMRHGTTTVEIKSGYGLDTATELKLLRVIARLQRKHPMTVVPTLLAAHAFPHEYRASDADRERYVELLIKEMLPAARELFSDGHFVFPLIPPPRADAEQATYPSRMVKTMSGVFFCDVFCEQGYFSVEQSERILHAAEKLGFHLKLHADQLSASGALELGVRCGAVSVDHLECTTRSGIQTLASSGTIGTVLPGCSLFLGCQATKHQAEALVSSSSSNMESTWETPPVATTPGYAPARAMIDAGCTIALATDFNPGSSMTYSMPAMMTLACTQMRLVPEEALTAATLNGAAALRLSDVIGRIDVGLYADVVLYDVPDWRMIPYHFAENHVRYVFKQGKRIV